VEGVSQNLRQEMRPCVTRKWVQGRDHGGEFQALPHDLWCHEEGSRDHCRALTLFAQGSKGTELIETDQQIRISLFSAISRR
jgi:hypothetical protein